MNAGSLPPFDAIRFGVSDGVGWLELNRPNAANARNQVMRRELMTVYEAIADDQDVRVLVLTAVGERFFCAGMDLKESANPETPSQRRRRLTSARDIEALAECPVPTIAAINGYALGGGLEMALACDLRIAAEEASLGLPEITQGLIPGGGATQRLPALVGAAIAFELLYLGTAVDGQTAHRLGLVNQCVPRADLAESAMSLARGVAEHSPTALRMVKQSVRMGLEAPPETARAAELDMLLELLAQADATTAP